jgi:hypothetical protein
MSTATGVGNASDPAPLGGDTASADPSDGLGSLPSDSVSLAPRDRRPLVLAATASITLLLGLAALL